MNKEGFFLRNMKHWVRRSSRHEVGVVSGVEQVEVDNISIEVFSQGKTPEKNGDRWVATEDYLAVIDGATANPPLLFNGFTSDVYASRTLAEILKTIPSGLYGESLIDFLTQEFHNRFSLLDSETQRKLVEKPYAQPYASLVVGSVIGNELFVTQLGDVSFRINGEHFQENPKEVDKIHAEMRRTAIRGKYSQEDVHGFLTKEQTDVGYDAILEGLRGQVIHYQNKTGNPLGYGVIDGTFVPREYIRMFGPIPLENLTTFEIVSDGYFKAAGQPTIASWEKSFREVEKEDPNKINAYPSVKGSSPNSFTDDRTVLIARIHVK